MIVIWFGCKPRQYTDSKFDYSKKDFYQFDSTKIRFDGYYSAYDSFSKNSFINTNPPCISLYPLVFIKKNRLFFLGTCVTYDAFQRCDFYKKIKTNYIGNFVIKGDSIFAYTPTEFNVWGMRGKPYYTNYSGYLKNSDTIINWRMIPPYPNVDLRFNECFYNDTIPRKLSFIKTDAVKCLDSLSSE